MAVLVCGCRASSPSVVSFMAEFWSLLYSHAEGPCAKPELQVTNRDLHICAGGVSANGTVGSKKHSRPFAALGLRRSLHFRTGDSEKSVLGPFGSAADTHNI